MKATFRVILEWREHSRCAREGETALSPKRSGEWAVVHAKEGARGGTMGSPAPNLSRCTGYRGIVEAVADLAGVEA